MRTKRRLQAMCIVLAVLFLVCFICFIKQGDNYNSLLAVVDDQSDLIDKQMVDNEEIVSVWKEDYEELLSDYGELLAENDALKKEIENIGDLPEYSYTVEEIETLCKCVQCEAGETSLASQRYVCTVVLNRVKSSTFPDNIIDVIYEKHDGVPQFSVSDNGMMDNCEVTDFTYHNVYYVLMFGTDMPEDVLFFYSTSVDENWVNTRKTWKVVDGTVFAY